MEVIESIYSVTPNYPNKHTRKCMALTKENVYLDLVSERVNKLRSISFSPKQNILHGHFSIAYFFSSSSLD